MAKNAGQKANRDNKVTLSRRQTMQLMSTAALSATTLKRPADAKLKFQPGTAVKRFVSKDSSLKRRASTDYKRSMSVWGGQLANSGFELRKLSASNSPFDVVIIGSGYGGAITAARLSQCLRPGRRLAVLERGREWIPGTFPDSFAQGAREFRNGTIPFVKTKSPQNQLGLYDMVYNKDMHVLVGNSLGGTSTINANVAIMPDAETFMSPRWPIALQDRRTLLPYYQRAAYELNLQRIDEDTPKAAALRNIADAMYQSRGNVAFGPANVAVTYQGRGLDAYSRNRQGVIQRACTLCGDCSSGCNVGAKNTLQMNYLPLAKTCGANFYTQSEVQTVVPEHDGYRIYFKHYEDCGQEDRAYHGSIRAKVVVLSAGSLGSTGILLRSRKCGLPVSNALGHSFSGNGDTVGVITKSNYRTNTAGYGAHETSQDPVGVTQQRNLHIDPHAELKYRMLIQEGAATRAYSSLLGGLLGDPNLDHSLFLLAVGHDEATGRIVLENGQPRVSWPNLNASPYYRYALAKLKQIAKQGGKRLRQFNALSMGKPTTVHPLGGCKMADDAVHGVTNDGGQVFNEYGACHPGLYVADGALIPTSLGANPLFTISAISERIAEGIVNDPAYADLFQVHLPSNR